MKFLNIAIEKSAEINFILAQSHFIKTVEDCYETLVEAVPGIKFGIAFCEASGSKKIRKAGTDEEMINLAVKNAVKIRTGHSLFIFLKNVFPINVLNRIKNLSEVVNIFCATANPTEIIVAETKLGRSILGVVDGESPAGVENEKEKKERKEFLRKIGYKQ
jgi:adenosine/AMP kinase